MFLQLFRSLARPKRNPPLSDASDNIFFDSMLYAILEKMHINEPDNYDADRFGFDGTVRAHRFYTQGAFQNLKLLIEAKDAFSASFDLLEDATSREWFKQLLLFRILGHMHVRLPSNRPEHWIMRERAKALAPIRPPLCRHLR